MTTIDSRRQFLKSGLVSSLAASGAVIGAPSLLVGCSAPKPSLRTQAQWDKEASLIKSQVVRPTFPGRTLNVATLLDDDDILDFNQALHNAIEQLSQQGGGKLIVPAGQWFSKGPIHLRSNINLHIEEGATITFSTTPDDYKPYVFTRWEGMELMGYSPLIYAFEEKNIAITGKGTLDGGAAADNWWPWKGKWKSSTWGDDAVENQKYTRDILQEMVEKGTPVNERVFENNYLRPPFIQPYRCENVVIEGVTILRSPFWLINPVLCKNVTVSEVYCNSFGPNSDGCDPESCTNVLIQGCTFDTGDDCIAIKSGRNADGRRVDVPCSNIVIENCQMKAGHGGVVIGSEISGGVENLYAQYCTMSSPDLDRGIRIKTNSIRGGHLKNLNYRNIDIGNVKDAVVVNFFYEEGDAGNFPPHLEDITIEYMQVKVAERAFVMRGYDHTPITGLTLNHISIEHAKKEAIIENVASLTINDVTINNKPFTKV
ncbi:exopolygalacturonase PelB [Alteromonas sp. D210916BOD_24]|uniref:glycoside hydrolase family 28 protein n=1 Tax=Alteromonas sp. D210916BOD_24 TaxID=3157618 RepID=UPI00399CAA18